MRDLLAGVPGHPRTPSVRRMAEPPVASGRAEEVGEFSQ